MTDDINVKGLAELDALLKQLPAKMEANILRSALRAGAVVVRDEAKQNVSVVSGQLRDGLKITTGSRGGVVTAKIKTTGKHAFLARWVEFGTASHKIAARLGGSLFFGGIFSKSILHPGARAKPFLRPALDSQATAAISAVAGKIRQRLTKQGLNAPDVEIGS